jgi:aspartate/methionine/tyrosine aminotransferase
VIASPDEIRGLAKLAAERDIVLLSDEIYRAFCYDEPFVSPATYNDRTLVIDGFSKSHGMTGWRLGFVHGPAEIIETMVKLQQYTFVCAPQPVQWAGAVALDVDFAARRRLSPQAGFDLRRTF